MSHLRIKINPPPDYHRQEAACRTDYLFGNH
nr:MAG TPA: hypothetical protein [Caudoviricetes sp.]